MATTTENTVEPRADSAREDSNPGKVASEGLAAGEQFLLKPGAPYHKHAVAERFRRTAAHRETLRESMKAIGQTEAVTCMPGEDSIPEVLDGITRIEERHAEGFDVIARMISERQLNGLTPTEWILKKNLGGNATSRELDKVEEALVVAGSWEDIAAEAAKRVGAGAKITNGTKGRTEQILVKKFPELDLAPNLMKQAVAVKKAELPALEEAVIERTISMSLAATVARLGDPNSKKFYDREKFAAAVKAVENEEWELLKELLGKAKPSEDESPSEPTDDLDLSGRIRELYDVWATHETAVEELCGWYKQITEFGIAKLLKETLAINVVEELHKIITSTKPYCTCPYCTGSA